MVCYTRLARWQEGHHISYLLLLKFLHIYVGGALVLFKVCCTCSWFLTNTQRILSPQHFSLGSSLGDPKIIIPVGIGTKAKLWIFNFIGVSKLSYEWEKRKSTKAIENSSDSFEFFFYRNSNGFSTINGLWKELWQETLANRNAEKNFDKKRWRNETLKSTLSREVDQ